MQTVSTRRHRWSPELFAGNGLHQQETANEISEGENYCPVDEADDAVAFGWALPRV